MKTCSLVRKLASAVGLASPRRLHVVIAYFLFDLMIGGFCGGILPMTLLNSEPMLAQSVPNISGGRVLASGYANWSVKTLNAVASGSQAVTLNACFMQVGSNGRFAPFSTTFNTNTPLTIYDGANTEIVTPSAVTTPTAAGPSAVNAFNCGFTATFANAHSTNVLVGSGDSGFMEAMNDAAALGASFVTVDSYSGITPALITGSTLTVANGGIIPNVIVEYTKSLGSGPNVIVNTNTNATGTESTNTVTLTTVSGNWGTAFAGGNMVVVSNCSVAGYNGTFALASGGSGGTTLTYLANTASMGAATGCVAQAAMPLQVNQPTYFALRPTVTTTISAPSAPTVTTTTGSLTSGAYYAMAAYVDCLGGVSLASTDSTQTATATGLVVASPAATAGACGWLPYITANGGSTGTEILAKQTIDSNICPLSTLETVIPACAIGSSATITAGNPSSTSKPVVESTAHTTFGFEQFGSVPLNFQTTFLPFVVGGTVNSSNEDLAQFYVPAGYFNNAGLGKCWNISFKGATATEVSTSVPVYKLQASNNYAQSAVTISTLTFGTYTQGAAGTQYATWKMCVGTTGTSGKFWSSSVGPAYNILNSAPTTFTGATFDITTAQSSALDLTKGLWFNINLAETAGANITGPIINLLTIEPVSAN